MNKYLKGFLILIITVGIGLFLINRYLNSGSTEPDNSVWEKYIGQDTTVGLWPDVYANYFTYTFIRTKDHQGLRITGEFPNTRYMSFNVYDLADKSTQGSIVDYSIQAQRAFHIDDRNVGDNYEVNIIPSTFQDAKLPNKLYFTQKSRMLLLVMRLYDFNEGNTGGVDLPKVQAFDVREDQTIQPMALPKPLNLRSLVDAPKIAEDIWFLYNSENLKALDGPKGNKQYYSLPFLRVSGEGMIQNNDNLYLLSAVTKLPGEVYYIRFKAPSFVTSSSTILTSEVRYWSMNIGDDLSYVFNAFKDEDCKIDEDGYVNIVIGENSEELKSRVQRLGFNFLEWNVPRKKGYLIYRNMLTKPGFEGNISKVPFATDGDKDSFETTDASLFIGEYAPRGYRMQIEDFYNEFDLNDE